MSILFIDGSGRPGSFNRALLEAFDTELQSIKPSTAHYVSLTSHPLPIMVLDADSNTAPTVETDAVRDLAMGASAFVLAIPEYNGGPTGGAKNMIDWMTRPNATHPKGNPFAGKPTVLLSASPGALGGIKGLQVMRLIMGHLRALVLPEQVALPHAHDAFEVDGRLKPGLPADLTKAAAAQLAEFV